MLTDLLPFVGTVLLLLVFPGPDLAIMVRNAASGGQRSARATAAGIVVGNAVLATVAVLGLTALLRSSEVAYTALRVAGAAYLLWLGIGALRDWWALGRHGLTDATVAVTAVPVSRSRAFRQGLTSNLLNPKVAMFYLALFPQFHLSGLGPTAGSVVLAGTLLALVVLWYVLLQAAVGAVEAFLTRRRTRRVLAGSSGVALTALSVVLLADR
ncbi:LysE family translocator [Solicola sp. PLA-1-18]|uniref:LysE family translocator n=1 Tax=Solicola sp. PLA-1-18 TaxID=3380532 RepID=UPI003B7ECC05